MFFVHAVQVQVFHAFDISVSSIKEWRGIKRHIRWKALGSAVNDGVVLTRAAYDCCRETRSELFRLCHTLVAQHQVFEDIGSRTNLVHRAGSGHSKSCGRGTAANIFNSNALVTDRCCCFHQKLGLFTGRKLIVAGCLALIVQAFEGIETGESQAGQPGYVFGE